MGKPSKAVLDFMSTYKVDSDEIWEVHGSTWVVKHKALERVAAEQGIVFDEPKYLPDSDVKQGFVTILVTGRKGEAKVWAFGEAGPKNNKNAYPVAMAEKRGKDRVILKLLDIHGALYSEAEADDFAQRRQETVTGEEAPDEDVITRDDGIQVLTMDAQRPIFEALSKEIDNCEEVETLKRWAVSAKSRASRLSGHWHKDLQARYLKRLRELEKRDALEYQERMTG